MCLIVIPNFFVLPMVALAKVDLPNFAIARVALVRIDLTKVAPAKVALSIVMLPIVHFPNFTDLLLELNPTNHYLSLKH
jgi:hypothetical protein